MSVLPSEIARALSALRPKGPRSCVVCGTEFVGTSRAKYCSRACATRADYRRNVDQRRAERRERYQRQKEQQQAADAAKEGQQP